MLPTAESLRSQTSKRLAQLAKKQGVPGWHSMRKEQLVRALLKLAKHKASDTSRSRSAAPTKSKKGARVSTATSRLSSNVASSKTNGQKKASKIKRQNARILRMIQEESRKREERKDLASQGELGTPQPIPRKDRVVLIVRDPFWLQVYWEVTPTTVRRAQVALAEHWHNATPCIRLMEIRDQGSANAVEQIVRDIPVHGGVKNWYIDVMNPPTTYRVALGYKGSNGKFQLLAKSNIVTTPAPHTSDSIDNHWNDIADNYQKYFALSGGYNDQGSNEELREVFEEQLRRPMTSPMLAQFGGPDGNGFFDFRVDAEMIIYGNVDPNASVTLGGEPVKLETDGTFVVRMPMPDRRQVLPVVACSRDGSEQRTTVLAIERNTKVMEPISREPEDK